jgi:hypothetical protein
MADNMIADDLRAYMDTINGDLVQLERMIRRYPAEARAMLAAVDSGRDQPGPGCDPDGGGEAA